MTVRVRFAPSPTGHVHIGNIRAAIFNWLFAQHEGGEFLLRVEDTDLERSTPEAIAALMDVMDWLDLSADEPPLYQTSQRDHHLQVAEALLTQGNAYRDAKGGDAEALVFQIPWNADEIPGVGTVGEASLKVHPDQPVKISRKGISYAGVSKKGKPVPAGACLAGFKDLEIHDAEGAVLFRLEEHIGEVLDQAAQFDVAAAARLTFTRRQIAYRDLVKGDLAKPLDSMKDFVIVRSDGSPVFHLANVCDDITQNISHIIRGDDHVENTYRHLFLFAALGATPPRYGHLPMIVNDQGKPYSKRDGDAFVGDFREKGYLPEALFNYLTLLGWAPGDDREKMTRQEIVEAFSLDRVQHASAQMDLKKLVNLNGQYMAELPFERFVEGCRTALQAFEWAAKAPQARLRTVAALMQSRTKLFSDVETWKHFFVEIPEYDAKAVRKNIAKPGIPEALQQLQEALADADFTSIDGLESVIGSVTEQHGIKPGKLNQPVRVAATGSAVGAGIYETLGVLGRDVTLKRLAYAITLIDGSHA